MSRSKHAPRRSRRPESFPVRVELLEERLPPGAVLILPGVPLAALSWGGLDFATTAARTDLRLLTEIGTASIQTAPPHFHYLSSAGIDLALLDPSPLSTKVPEANAHSQPTTVPVPMDASLFPLWNTNHLWNLFAGADFGPGLEAGAEPIHPSALWPADAEAASPRTDSGSGGTELAGAGSLVGKDGSETGAALPAPASPGDTLFAALQVLARGSGSGALPGGGGGPGVQNVGAACDPVTNGQLTIDVQANTISAAVATPVLANGETYTLVASGDAKIGNDLEKRGDAEFYWAGSTPSTYYQGTDVGIRFVSPPPGFSNWGAVYKSDHVYWAKITGRGTTESVYYLDAPGAYADNVGTVRLDIYKGECLAPDTTPD